MVKVEVNYYNLDGSLSHTYSSNWENTGLFCLNCGERGLFAEDNGDYYEGETHICLKCGYFFNLPRCPDDGKEDEQKRQVLAQLRKHKADIG